MLLASLLAHKWIRLGTRSFLLRHDPVIFLFFQESNSPRELQDRSATANMTSLQYAIQASDRLRVVADSLCGDTSCVQFCATLEVVLSRITKWLRTLPSNEESERDAIELLDELESLCQPRDAAQPATPAKGPYPALDRLIVDAEAVIMAIRNLANSNTCHRQRQKALASLGVFLPQVPEEKIAISPSDIDLRAASEEPPEYDREIKSLHRALLMHCCCADSKKVVAHIRLRSCVHDDTKVMFGVIFKAHPHHDGCYSVCSPWWQDTHISVQRERAVTFEARTSCEHECVGLDSDPSFCTYISAQEERGLVLLHFSVMGHKLYFKDEKEPPRLWELDSPSISLGQLLGEVFESSNNLTEKMKEVLSWLLVKAVWQYYSSPWMREPWDKESVHFLFERRRNDEGEELAGIFLNEPLLSVSIVPYTSGTDANNLSHHPALAGKKPGRPLPFSRPLHQIPKILALGVMLVEIQLGRPIESLYSEAKWSQYCPKGKANPNTNFKICKALIAKAHFFTDVSDPLENLIKNCIQPNHLFVPPHVKDEEGIREALYGLVNGLEVYLSKGKPNNVKPLSLPRIFALGKKKISRSTSPSAPPATSPARLVRFQGPSSSQLRRHSSKTTTNAFENA